MQNFRQIKKELRVVGIDDAPFESKGEGSTLLVGAVFRAGEWCDGVLSRKIKVDGMDATEKIISMINESRHSSQLRVILLDGITFGGMNTADIQKINKETGLGVVVVNRKMPDYEKIKKALDNFEDGKERWALVEKAGQMHEIEIGEHKLYIQVAGVKIEDAKEITELCSTRSHIPEPLRVAHLIARGVTLGESKGGA